MPIILDFFMALRSRLVGAMHECIPASADRDMQFCKMCKNARYSSEIPCRSENTGGNKLHECFWDYKQDTNIVKTAKKLLAGGEDPAERNDYGYTALDIILLHHCKKTFPPAPCCLPVDKQVTCSCTLKVVEMLLDKDPVDLEVMQSVAQSADLFPKPTASLEVNYTPVLVPAIIQNRLSNEASVNKLAYSSLFDDGITLNSRNDGDNNSYFGHALQELFALFRGKDGCDYVLNMSNLHHLCNAERLTPLHISAWRGNVGVIVALLRAGADVNAVTSHGHNALHVLYVFCTNPDQLVRCTQTLLHAKININQKDQWGRSCFDILMSKCMPALCHQSTKSPAFRNILQSAELLLDSGLDPPNSSSMGTVFDTLLSTLCYGLGFNEVNCVNKECHLSQYHIGCFIEVLELLVSRSSEFLKSWKNGVTPLMLATLILRVLDLRDAQVLSGVQRLFHMLMQSGVNAQTDYGECVAHMVAFNCGFGLVDVNACITLFQMLLRNSLDVSVYDKVQRNAVFYLFLSQRQPNDGSWCSTAIQSLTVLLLQNGAISTSATQSPILLVMGNHVVYHPVAQTMRAKEEKRRKRVLANCACVVKLLSSCTSYKVLHMVSSHMSVRLASSGAGFQGVRCMKSCPVYDAFLEQAMTPRALTHQCRLTIWAAMKSPGLLEDKVKLLPYPKPLQDYLLWRNLS